MMTPRWFQILPWIGRIAIPLAVFSAVMALGALLLLNPLSVALVQALVALQGEPFAGNFGLIPFFLSPVGFLTVAVAAGTAIFLAAIEFGGLVLIAWDGLRGQPIRFVRMWRRLASRLPSLLVLTATIFAAVVVLLIPVGVATYAAYTTWLTGGDIYFYVTTRPREFYLAAGLVGITGLAAAFVGLLLAIRWFLAVPFCVLDGAGAGEALRMSAAAMPGNKRRLVLGLLGWVAVALLLSAVAAGGFAILKSLIAPGSQIETAGRAILLLYAAGTVLIAVVSGLSRAVLSVIAVGLYADAGGNSKGVPQESEPGRGRIRQGLVAAACIALPMLAAGQAFWALDAFDIDRPVAVTAHRAGAGAAPENTLAALERAIQAKADFAEIDVQETKDGEIVVIHDTDLRRVAHDPRSIWEITASELRMLDAGSWFDPQFRGERIPTLREFALASKGRIRLNVELKVNGHGMDLAGRTLAILDEAGVLDETVISSLDIRILAQVRALRAGVPIGFIASAGVGSLAALDVDFYSLARRIATPATVRRLHSLGRGVHVWGLPNESAIVDAVLDGADNVITDDPAFARRTVSAIFDMTAPEIALLRLRRAFERQGFRLF